MNVLYTMYHSTALLWTLVHRLSVHPEDKAYLLVANAWTWCLGNKKYLPMLKQCVDNGIFEAVYMYDNSTGRDKVLYDTLEKTENAILYGLDKQLKDQDCDINSFDVIYSNTEGEDTLGIYLSLKKKEFYWFETKPNMLTARTEQGICSEYEGTEGYKAALLKHKTIFGKSELQSYVFCPESDRSSFPEERCVVFDSSNAAEMLSFSDKAKILRSLGLEKANFPTNATMIVQNNGAFEQTYYSCDYIKRKYSNHMHYLYSVIQCALDYLVPKDTLPVLKFHHSIVLEENIREKYFNGIEAFPALATMLLTKLLVRPFEVNYKLTIDGGFNEPMLQNAEEILCPELERSSLFYHKYYVALDIVNRLGGLYKKAGERFEETEKRGTTSNGAVTHFAQGMNHLIDIHFPDVPEHSEYRWSVIQVSDDCLQEKILENDFIVFTDVWETVNCDNQEQVLGNNYVVPVKLRKVPVKPESDILTTRGDEYIYFVTNNEKWYQKVLDYNLVKYNEYEGVSLVGEVQDDRCQVAVRPAEYALNTNFSLYECYKNFGRNYCDKKGNEVVIGGEITRRALENMKEISVKFGNLGRNKVIFKDLDTPYKYAGKFRVEALSNSKIEIGRVLFANAGVLVHSANAEVFIDDDVMFANGVVVRAMNYHPIYSYEGKRFPNKNLFIGKHVWLGFDSIVYAGAVINSGSIVGASSVVAGKVPNNCIVVGNPARVIKKDIFWQYTNDMRDYYDLPESIQEAGEYIQRTEM